MVLCTPDDLTRWEALGFELVEEAEAMASGSQFLVMNLARVHPRVVELEGQANAFELVNGPGGEDEDEDEHEDDGDEDEVLAGDGSDA